MKKNPFSLFLLPMIQSVKRFWQLQCYVIWETVTKLNICNYSCNIFHIRATCIFLQNLDYELINFGWWVQPLGLQCVFSKVEKPDLFSQWTHILTHWGRDKMAAFFQTTFSNAFSLIKISLKFVPTCPINNIPGLVQIMAWRWPGDKPLSEPMMVSLLTHICVTRPQWVNDQAHHFINKIPWIKSG